MFNPAIIVTALNAIEELVALALNIKTQVDSSPATAIQHIPSFIEMLSGTMGKIAEAMSHLSEHVQEISPPGTVAPSDQGAKILGA